MSNTEIWDKYGDLVPLRSIKSDDSNCKDVAVVIVNRDQPEMTDQLVEQIQRSKGDLSVDIYVIELGSVKQSKYASLHYDDPDFRGKAYGHNVGVRYAKARGNYRYYFTAMNDLKFTCKNGLAKLVAIADAHTKAGILSPTEPDSSYAGGLSKPVAGVPYQRVSQANYLALLIRGELIEQGLYLNPDFRYCWGATHELSHQLYSRGYEVGYVGSVTMLHFGSSVYGKVAGVPKRSEYLLRARQFAARYMVEKYGKKWDDVFTAALPPVLQTSRYNSYHRHRASWEKSLPDKERQIYQLQAADQSLQSKIYDLHPWFYPVAIDGIKVIPGIGAPNTAKMLSQRTVYRRRILVDEVVKRYDFAGKRLADIGANCGYWSSYYAQQGASQLVALEGRESYAAQGRLFWGHNKFLPAGQWEFQQGNALDVEWWSQFPEKHFDFTLCAGLLYHIPQPLKLLELMAARTREVLLLDTRVGQLLGPQLEKGGAHFDSIAATSNKRIPVKSQLLATLDQLGFTVEQLPEPSPIPVGMLGHDDYTCDRRVALLATRRT
jgi:hypothetical protein